MGSCRNLTEHHHQGQQHRVQREFNEINWHTLGFERNSRHNPKTTVGFHLLKPSGPMPENLSEAGYHTDEPTD
jgi:hypothetical protein